MQQNMMQDEQTRNTKIELIELVVIRSHPIYRRSQEIKATNSVLSGMEESFSRFGTRAFDNEILMKTAPELIRYTAAPVEEVRVPYGWDNEKLSFEIVASTHDAYGVYKTVLKGFTDKFDMSYTNKLDPQTMFYIDNVINTTASIDISTGAISPERITSAYSVMSDPMTGVNSLALDTSMMGHVAIRPEDIILGMAAKTSNIEDRGITTNALNTLTANATPAKVKDLNPMNNIGEVMNSMSFQMTNEDFHSDPTTAVLGALNQSVEYRVDSQPFFKKLGASMFTARVGQFSLQDLHNAFGDTTHVTNLIMSNSGSFQMDGDSSGGISVEASLANMFLDTSMSYLRKYGIINISFTVTNLTLDGSTQISLIGAPGTNVFLPNLMQLTDRALEEIRQFAFPIVSADKYPVSITMNLSKTDALITLEFEGRPMQSFSFSLLAYSLAIPTIGTQQESTSMINSVSGLSDLIIQEGNINGTTQIIY